MLRRKDDETVERGVGLWLMKKGIPYQRYDNLSAYLKGVLRKLLCIPTRTTSPSQRQDLWKALCLPDVGRNIDPDDFVPPDEKLQEFFSPLTPSETLSDFEKY